MLSNACEAGVQVCCDDDIMSKKEIIALFIVRAAPLIACISRSAVCEAVRKRGGSRH